MKTPALVIIEEIVPVLIIISLEIEAVIRHPLLGPIFIRIIIKARILSYLRYLNITRTINNIFGRDKVRI
jgi:hypothetical protein